MFQDRVAERPMGECRLTEIQGAEPQRKIRPRTGLRGTNSLLVQGIGRYWRQGHALEGVGQPNLVPASLYRAQLRDRLCP